MHLEDKTLQCYTMLTMTLFLAVLFIPELKGNFCKSGVYACVFLTQQPEVTKKKKESPLDRRRAKPYSCKKKQNKR